MLHDLQRPSPAAWLTCLSGGARRGVSVAELPSGTVTFPSTDFEGWTRLWQEHPEAMNAASFATAPAQNARPERSPERDGRRPDRHFPRTRSHARVRR